MPLSLFEIGDCVVKFESEIGARNLRKIVALYTDHDNSGLELIHGLMDQIMKKLDIKLDL
jgi:hypothetical protein